MKIKHRRVLSSHIFHIRESMLTPFESRTLLNLSNIRSVSFIFYGSRTYRDEKNRKTETPVKIRRLIQILDNFTTNFSSSSIQPSQNVQEI